MALHSTTSSVQASASKGRHDASWLERIGRLGYSAKGVVYLMVGGLALASALGIGGSVGGSKNAIARIEQWPLGQVALAFVAAGLACYTLWRVLQVFNGARSSPTDRATRVAKRVTYAVSGLTHATLVVYAVSVLFNARSSLQSSGSGNSDWTATLLQQPFGPWLVGMAGTIIFSVGIRQFYRASQATFLKKYKRNEMEANASEVAKRSGQVGLAARGVVFCMVGVFVVQAAINADPSEAKGLGGALTTLLAQPYGRWLLGLLALGLATYGLFCFSYVRWRDFDRVDPGRQA